MNPDGTATVVLSNMAGTADLALLEDSGLVIVPRMGEGIVTAFTVPGLAIAN